jgi:hypothetical protein
VPTVDLFDTHQMNRWVRQLDIDPSAFLTNTFFSMAEESDSEYIYFDRENDLPRITPLVHPMQQGRLVEKPGYTTDSFKPAYAKDKRSFDAGDARRRAPGEVPFSQLSASERIERAIQRNLADMNRMLTRREEVMVSEIMRTGTVTVAGTGFETVVVDFQRDAALTVADLTGTARWSESTATPVSDLETWASLIQGKNGGVATDVIMANDVWGAIRDNTQVVSALDVRRGGDSRAELGPLTVGVRNPGRLGDFNIWIYTEQYADEDGALQELMPSGTVIMASRNVLGVRHYGMIEDFANSFGAQRWFVKSWEEEDPSRRIIMGQSAPLPVPYRPNATLAVDVLNGGP